MIGIKQLFGGKNQLYRQLQQKIGFDIKVAIPAIVQSFDKEKQTIEAQPAVRERVVGQNGEISYVSLPLLINVPVLFQQAGGYIMAMPVSKGDECLIIFSDLSIDNWWLSGGVQNPVEQRRHDLSDGLAIVGLQNQSKLQKIEDSGYSPDYEGIELLNTSTGAGVKVLDEDGYISAVVTVTLPDGTKVKELRTKAFSEIIE